MIISSSFSYLLFHWWCFNVLLFRQCSIIVLRCFTVLRLFWRCSVVPVVFYGKPSQTYVQKKFLPQSSLCASFICLCALFIRFALFSFGYTLFTFKLCALFIWLRVLFIPLCDYFIRLGTLFIPLYALSIIRSFMRSFYVLFLCVLFSMPRL